VEAGEGDAGETAPPIGFKELDWSEAITMYTGMGVSSPESAGRVAPELLTPTTLFPSPLEIEHPFTFKDLNFGIREVK